MMSINQIKNAVANVIIIGKPLVDAATGTGVSGETGTTFTITPMKQPKRGESSDSVSKGRNIGDV